MEWLEPWRPVVGKEATGLERVLRREVGRDHELYGLGMRALARRGDCDDVLFAIQDGTGRVADVHLTWTRDPPERAPWPIAIIFSSFEVWRRDGMQSDHDDVASSGSAGLTRPGASPLILVAMSDELSAMSMLTARAWLGCGVGGRRCAWSNPHCSDSGNCPSCRRSTAGQESWTEP
jgi:hypothetical protein